MTMDRKDRVLADFLRRDEPPDRDPAFRLAVLERRARQIFRRKLIATLIAALAFSVALAVAVRASASPAEIGSLLIVGAGLVVSWRCYAPVLADWMRIVLSMSQKS
jgi:hypothetical protein